MKYEQFRFQSMSSIVESSFPSLWLTSDFQSREDDDDCSGHSVGR